MLNKKFTKDLDGLGNWSIFGEKTRKEKMNGKLLFVGGDLSGIQKFIYNISSKKAMVSLKGRSAYLKEFTDDVCNRILDIPEISGSHSVKDDMKIYCSGGKFYLQIPDTDEIRTAIDKIRLDIEKDLWDEHFGQLAINIGYVPFRYVDGKMSKVLIDGSGKSRDIGELWKNVTDIFSMQKKQKFKSLLPELFDVQEINSNEKVCEVTGIEGAVSYKIKFEDKEEELFLLKSVKEQIDLGLKLKKQDNFKTFEEYAGDTYLGVLRMDVDGLGNKFIHSSFRSISEYKEFSNELDFFFTNKLYEFQKDTQFVNYLNIVYAGGDDLFIVGRWDKVIDFAELIREKFRNYCVTTLKDDKLSISGGIAIVSKTFPIAKAALLAGDAEAKAKDYEFERGRGKKNSFCLFGQPISWREPLLNLLTNVNNNLTLENIDELLDFIIPQRGHLLQEYSFVKANKVILECLITSEILSKAILHKLMLWYSIVEDNEKKKNGDLNGNADYSYIWHSAYYLTRYSDRFAAVNRKNNNGEHLSYKESLQLRAYKYCLLLRDKIIPCNDNGKRLRLMSVAARWTELSLR